MSKMRRVNPFLSLMIGLLLGVFFAGLPPRFGHIRPSKERIAIVVLGGGLQNNGDIYPHVELRVQEALRLYNQFKALSPDLDVTILPLSGGTPHKPPPRDEAGFPITEARGSAKRLVLDLKVPANDVMEEAFSLDTLGNAYWLRLIHIEPGYYTKMIVVTNSWHMDRTKAFFSHVFNLPWASGQGPLPASLAIEYKPVEPGLGGEVLSARIAREKKSLQYFEQETSKKFSTVEELHDFIFTQHSAYASSRLLKQHVEIDKTVAQTY